MTLFISLKNQYARVRNTEEMTAREMIRNYRLTLLNLTQQNSDRPKEGNPVMGKGGL